jgi:hypothetical protein
MIMLLRFLKKYLVCRQIPGRTTPISPNGEKWAFRAPQRVGRGWKALGATRFPQKAKGGYYVVYTPARVRGVGCGRCWRLCAVSNSHQQIWCWLLAGGVRAWWRGCGGRQRVPHGEKSIPRTGSALGNVQGASVRVWEPLLKRVVVGEKRGCWCSLCTEVWVRWRKYEGAEEFLWCRVNTLARCGGRDLL